MKNTTFCLGLMLIIGLSFTQNSHAQTFRSNFTVDLRKYIGVWYETARTANEFQDNIVSREGEEFTACYNSTATYDLLEPGQIGVRNRCTRRSSSGKTFEDTVRGRAVVQEDRSGRKLKIAFGSGVARFFQRAISGGGFDYWIYCLGPVNSKNVYDWAIVSGPDRDYVFILTRDKFVSNAKRKTILDCARKEGLPTGELLFLQR